MEDLQKAIEKKPEEHGYTLIYNSYGLVLVANEPFDSKAEAIREEKDIMVSEKNIKRKLVADADIGKELQEEVNDLKLLLNAYREGKIKERI